jgi:UDP-N-acetylmuramate: L-alanyl-gamma-D-glutamyl-meso-diaminopimelate ligase
VDGITVIDDFAHHPTEVKETIAAVKKHFGGRRLWAVWEPRTNSSRKSFFQQDYPKSFLEADEILVAPVYHSDLIEQGERFVPERLVHDLQCAGKRARFMHSIDAMVQTLLRELGGKDVVLIMSNGAFENIHERLINGLKGRHALSSCDPV